MAEYCPSVCLQSQAIHRTQRTEITPFSLTFPKEWRKSDFFFFFFFHTATWSVRFARWNFISGHCSNSDLQAAVHLRECSTSWVWRNRNKQEDSQIIQLSVTEKTTANITCKPPSICTVEEVSTNPFISLQFIFFYTFSKWSLLFRNCIMCQLV